MAKFSTTGQERLATCHEDLQKLFNKVVQFYDCTIIVGHRGQVEQHKAFLEKKSKLDWPNGKHNTTPSMAVDVAPCINGSPSFVDRQCSFFAGYVLRVAEEMGIKVRLGADWDGDKDITDQTFNDTVHFELI